MVARRLQRRVTTTLCGVSGLVPRGLRLFFFFKEIVGSRGGAEKRGDSSGSDVEECCCLTLPVQTGREVAQTNNGADCVTLQVSHVRRRLTGAFLSPSADSCSSTSKCTWLHCCTTAGCEICLIRLMSLKITSRWSANQPKWSNNCKVGCRSTTNQSLKSRDLVADRI